MRRRSSDRSTRSRLAEAAYLLACAIALASIGWACGGEEASPPPAAAPAEPGQAAPGEPALPAAAIPAAPGAAEPGNAIAAEGVIPEGFPSDVPVYPGAKPGSSMTMPGLGVFATFESSDAVPKIVEHYRGELSKSGWSVTDSPDGGGVDAAKGNRSVQVRARQNEQGGTEIAVNVSES
jgi:hypothetical protein